MKKDDIDIIVGENEAWQRTPIEKQVEVEGEEWVEIMVCPAHGVPVRMRFVDGKAEFRCDDPDCMMYFEGEVQEVQ